MSTLLAKMFSRVAFAPLWPTGSPATKEPTETPGWEFTANFRLGRHWQEAGDYVRAQAAYEAARDLAPGHRPTLYNLAVVQIRRGFYVAARRTLDDLCRIEGLPTDAPGDGTWRDALYPIAYQRALILDYEEEYLKASKWSGALAEHASDEPEGDRGEPQTVGAALKLPSLTLHASILIERHSDTKLPQQTAEALLDRPAKVVERPDLTKPASIVAYVERHPAVDARTNYNLTCFLSRLADLVPWRADELVEQAVDRAESAMQDPYLVAWAKRDPSLRPVQQRREWTELLERIEPEEEAAAPAKAAAASASASASAPASAEPAAPEPKVRHERQQVIENAVAALRAHGVLPGIAAAVERLEALRARALQLTPRRFEIELASAVAATDDPGTIYRIPTGTAMALPFTLAEDDERVLVSHREAGPPPNAEVAYWNGLPIEEALALRAEHIGAPTPDARRARALASLTHRPAGYLAPFDEGDVEVGYRVEGRETVSVGWEPIDPYAPDAPETLPWSLDPLAEAIAQARGPGRATEAGATEARATEAGTIGTAVQATPYLRIRTFRLTLEEIAEAVGAVIGDPPTDRSPLILDLRGNPGGSIHAADRVLQLLFGEAPAQTVELRASKAVEDLVGPYDRSWAKAVASARHAGRDRTEPLPVSQPERVERRHHGKVVLVVDALCGGAAANLALRFAAHGLGDVVCTTRRPGLLAGLTTTLPKTRPERGALSVTFGRLSAGDGRFAPTEVHPPTFADEAAKDPVLLFAAGMAGRRS